MGRIIVWTTAPQKALEETIYQRLPEDRVKVYRGETPPVVAGEDIVLSMGAKNLEALQQAGILKKGRKMGSLRGTPVSVNGRPLFVTYDPGIIHRDWARYEDILWDATLAKRLSDTGKLTPELGDYVEISGAAGLRLVLDAAFARSQENTPQGCPLVLDLETVGLNPYDPDAWIVSYGLAMEAGEGEAYVRYFEKGEAPDAEERGLLQGALTSEWFRVRGANLKFDLAWLWERWGLHCTNFSFDTTIVGSLLDENRSNSLNSHAKVFTPIGGYDDEFNKKHDKSRMDLVPRAEVITYNGGDCDACLRVSEAQIAALSKQPRLLNFYVNLLHPAARALELMERTGIVIDVPYSTLR